MRVAWSAAAWYPRGVKLTGTNASVRGVRAGRSFRWDIKPDTVFGRPFDLLDWEAPYAPSPDRCVDTHSPNGAPQGPFPLLYVICSPLGKEIVCLTWRHLPLGSSPWMCIGST
jgi:hypothetical protein